MAKEELDIYFDLIWKLKRAANESSKRKVGKKLAKLLRSHSDSLSRSVKYKLRKEFAIGVSALNQWSPWGPPGEGEIIWWENYFQN